MNDYIAYISCDTAFFRPLEGVYNILKYTLEPCEVRERSQHRGVQNFTISFPFTGVPEIGLIDSENIRNSFLNQQKSIEEAKLFIAWLTAATRHPLDLSHVGFGEMQHFGPCSHEPVDDFNRERTVRIHHIKENAVDGTYEHVKRPFIDSEIRSKHTFGIPHDFPDLSMKLYSLPDEQREIFFDSCLSYQFAMIHSGTLPSVSLVALVNVVESFMRNRFSSGYCEDAQQRCNLKRDIGKKFRAFFEENLIYPLPNESRKFLQDVYSNRSNFVHNALMGSDPTRGPSYLSLGKDRELKNQLASFEQLVNICMINWLMRI